MQRAIIGFQRDEHGDWAALLECGHRQHVRHRPPFAERPWVLSEEGRAGKLGARLECAPCREGGAAARPEPRAAAERIRAQRYPEAALLWLAGSAARGDATAHSDLDLVVLFERVECARREAFRAHGWPVEAFVHDSGTLRYFIEVVDPPTGIPALAQMLADGVPIPAATQHSDALQAQARAALDAGPPALGAEALEERRYALTDGLGDLRAPRSREECIASGARLYAQLADLALRARGRWSASGKAVPAALRAADPQFASRFASAFDALFARGETAPALALGEEILAQVGGPLFEGFSRRAPPGWRR